MPSKALLVPANRFELLECRAAVDAVGARELDGDSPRPGALDVLVQHVTGVACSAPFAAAALYDEVRRAWPYRELSRRDFDDVLDFVSTGGYALGAYERFRRLEKDAEGLWRPATKDLLRRWRMKVGPIVEAPMLKVRPGGRIYGAVEEYLVYDLVLGDKLL